MEQKLTDTTGLNVAVIGAGTAGARLANNVRMLGITCTVFSRRTHGDDILRRSTRGGGWDDFSHIVVATENASHEEILLRLADSQFGGSVLVEKPGLLSSGSLSKMLTLNLRVAFNLRFLAGFSYLRKEISNSQPLSASIVCHSDLRLWRKAWDRAGQYSLSKAKGGGVLFDLSHELDYASYLFGPWREFHGIGGKLGNFTLDADDTWKIIAEFGEVLVSIDLSTFSRFDRRNVRVNFANKTVDFNLLTGRVRDSEFGASDSNLVGTTYLMMIQNWIFEEGSKLPNALENLKTLELIRQLQEKNVTEGN